MRLGRGENMRKKIAIIGLIMLVVGIAMFAISTFGVLHSTTVGTAMTQQSSGIWASSEINISSGYQLTLITHTSSFGVVPASDLSSVTSSNLTSLSISWTAQTNTSVGTVTTYSPASGSYYLVVLSSSMPSATYSTATSLTAIAVYGILDVVGIIVGIIGFIVLIVGLILKRKDVGPPNEFMQ